MTEFTASGTDHRWHINGLQSWKYQHWNNYEDWKNRDVEGVKKFGQMILGVSLGLNPTAGPVAG